MPELSALGWAVLVLGAAVIGLSKAALPGAGTVAVALFAAVLPAKESTGTILLLLIVGDVFALISYRRHADWRTIVRLAPAVVVGLVIGAVFLGFASDVVVRVTIGVLLLLVVGITLWRRRAVAAVVAEPSRVAAGLYGSVGGFTTMVANAAGPVMSMYFLAARFPVQAFLGTSAWFFAIVNVAKLPFSIGLGLIGPGGLLIDLVLAPVVIAAAFVGRAIARRIDQRLFERIVIVLTVAGSLYLLLPR
ncbi:MAG: sulfite exporter TauE/SafE family protein [Microbacterium sp.]|uniref:sulfite exporter TauE/SafE family protein n=1 Tax=Microbacterium sp. TaxID=51671 RepID=UPI001ACCFB6A|nr:sulfite exporter TauE/SafE family protein [Microbacterium sp.]MBN9176612.1 sulfite exporter TauE/SafE family protein [Microbacterium sp.]